VIRGGTNQEGVDMSTALERRIVVGVTDSTKSRWALAWAVGTAVERDCR
jgi:hypothetical protein